jgi:DNA gyrase/topoisomerase IV subunit B
VLLGLSIGGAAWGQSFIAEIKAEHDPGKRVQMALDFADQSFDTARDYYNKGFIHKGDEHLDYMTAALRECLDALQESHKAKFYKKAEMNVADLERRLGDLVTDISVPDRGWAEYTSRKVDELHDKMLEGVMRK